MSGMMANALQTLSSPRWREVERKANELSALYSAPPIPALEIAERCGVDVVFADFGNSSDTVAGFCDFASAKLYVNHDDITVRQTFTIAHELGHWVMHKEYFDTNPSEYDILPRMQKVSSNDAFEQEANFFAANLLVPKRLLRPVQNASVASLADAFAVSRTMMEHRLKNVR